MLVAQRVCCRSPSGIPDNNSPEGGLGRPTHKRFGGPREHHSVLSQKWTRLHRHMYIYICVCISVYMHTQIHVHSHTHAHMPEHIHIHIIPYIHMCI